MLSSDQGDEERFEPTRLHRLRGRRRPGHAPRTLPAILGGASAAPPLQEVVTDFWCAKVG